MNLVDFCTWSTVRKISGKENSSVLGLCETFIWNQFCTNLGLTLTYAQTFGGDTGVGGGGGFTSFVDAWWREVVNSS